MYMYFQYKFFYIFYTNEIFYVLYVIYLCINKLFSHFHTHLRLHERNTVSVAIIVDVLQFFENPHALLAVFGI